MKNLFWTCIPLFLLLFGFNLQARVSGGGAGPYKKPEKCYQANYACVLKYEAGKAFFCLKATEQRLRDAKRQPRRVLEMRCIQRYPAILKEPKPGAKSNG